MADEYIRKQDAVMQLSHNKRRGDDEWELAVVSDMEIIRTMPSADVVQVVHAYWIQTSVEDEDGNAYYSCSNCGSGESHNPIVEVPYCWKCGAKMDAHGER